MRAFIGVVIAFIPLSILLFFPVFGRVGSGRQDALISRLHQLYVAASLYRDDNNAFPDMRTSGGLQRALRSYVAANSDEFRNPTSNGPINGNSALSGKGRGKLWAEDSEIALFWAPNGRTDRPITAVHIDGRAHRYSLPEWDAVRRRSRIP